MDILIAAPQVSPGPPAKAFDKHRTIRFGHSPSPNGSVLRKSGVKLKASPPHAVKAGFPEKLFNKEP